MKKVVALRIIELVGTLFLVSLVIYNSISIENGLYLKESIQYLPLMIYFLLNLCVLVESLLVKITNKMLYSVFSLAIATSMYQDSIAYANATFWFFSCIYCIFIIMSLIKKEKVETTYLPPFIFSKKHYQEKLKLKTVFLFLANFVAICTMFLPLVLSLILIVLLFFSYFVFKSQTPLVKAGLQLNKDLNFQILFEKFDQWLQEPLHPETINIIKTWQANYLFLLDMSKGLDLFKETYEPKEINFDYKLIEICYYINQNQKESAYECFQNLKKTFKFNKGYIQKLDNLLKIHFTDEEIPNIEKLYPEAKFRLSSLLNHQILMRYYDSRKQLQNALIHANYILENGQACHELYKEAQNIKETMEGFK